MKVLKKLSILLALCMAAVLVLAACGPKGGGTTPTQKDEPQTEEVTTKEAEPEDTGYPEATLKGDTYTNEAINLQMKVPSTWTLYTKEQLADESMAAQRNLRSGNLSMKRMRSWKMLNSMKMSVLSYRMQVNIQAQSNQWVSNPSRI